MDAIKVNILQLKALSKINKCYSRASRNRQDSENLNIIANILVQGKTVQVVSNNNPAIENIYEKLENPRYNLDFLVARLGKVENRNQFINNQNENYPNFNNWKIKSENITTEKLKKSQKH